MIPKTSAAVEEGEQTPEFLLALETATSDRAALPDLMPSTVPPSTPQAASNAGEEVETVALPQLRESNALDAAIAPLLLQSLLIPSQAGTDPVGLAPITEANPLDHPQSQLGQVSESATLISSQISPTPSSSTRLADAGQEILAINLPESHPGAPSFAMPTSAGVDATDTALTSVADGMPEGNLRTAWADRSGLPPDTTPRILQTVDRPLQASPMVDSPLLAEASSFPDSATVSRENAHATVPGPSLSAPAATPLESHAVPSPANADANPRQPFVGGQQSPLTMETAGETEVAADPGLLNEDHHDPPSRGDLQAPATPQTRNLGTSEAPVGYTEAAQRASVMLEASITTDHSAPADPRGIHAEPKPIITQLIDHLRVTVNGTQQELRMQLTPENLGTVQVNIVTEQLEVQARLLVENLAVKEALEANLHKLREALQAQGLQVQDINVAVSQHAPQHESIAGRFSFEERRWKSPKARTASEPTREISAVSGRGTSATDLRQVDLFA